MNSILKRLVLICLSSLLLAAAVTCPAAESLGMPKPSSTTVPQMIGATKVEPGQSPWQVALVSSEGSPVQTVFCGGTLIDSQWVLTAAHCFFEPKTCIEIPRQAIYVAYGSEDLGIKYSLISSKELLYPKEYSCGNKPFDIALIKLAEPINVTKFVQLATTANVSPLVKPGSKLMAAGWGLTKVDGWKSRYLMEVEIPVVNEEQCRAVYGKIWPKGAICAGEFGKDACSGDSGGPLYRRLKGTDKVIQVGVVSFGDGCGKDKTPGAYTSVAEYLPWIEEKIQTKPCTPQDIAEKRC